MPVSAGALVYGSDYNVVQAKVVRVLGSGAPDGPGTANVSFGYNVALTSSTVSATQLITQTQWNNLSNDINTVIVHQTGTNYSGYANISGTITASNLNNLENIINTGTTNRLTVHPTQLSTAVLNTNLIPGAWGSPSGRGQQTVITLTFSSVNNMQYYFNQGGSLRIQGIKPSGDPYSGSTATQNLRWKALLESWNYTFNATTLAALTGSYTQISYLQETVAPYTANYIKAEGLKSGATITLRISFWDGHAASGAGPDGVNAGAGYSLSGSSAVGAFTGVPNPTHSINLPWYQITSAP